MHEMSGKRVTLTKLELENEHLSDERLASTQLLHETMLVLEKLRAEHEEKNVRWQEECHELRQTVIGPAVKTCDVGTMTGELVEQLTCKLSSTSEEDIPHFLSLWYSQKDYILNGLRNFVFGYTSSVEKVQPMILKCGLKITRRLLLGQMSREPVGSHGGPAKATWQRSLKDTERASWERIVEVYRGQYGTHSYPCTAYQQCHELRYEQFGSAQGLLDVMRDYQRMPPRKLTDEALESILWNKVPVELQKADGSVQELFHRLLRAEAVLQERARQTSQQASRKSFTGSNVKSQNYWNPEVGQKQQDQATSVEMSTV